MERLNRKTILGIAVIMLATLFVVTTFVWKSQEDTTSNTINVQSPPRIEGVQIPNGWYTHETRGLEGTSTVLTRAKNLPDGAAEQVGISIMETQLTPEDFIPRQGVVGGNLDSRDARWSWGIYQGHKTFSMTLAPGGVQQWFVYIFGGDKIYQFVFSPNDQTNSNLAQDRTDFWKVITYYAQNPSFERLSREETQQNCKMISLPEGQEYNIQAEPETGYVVVSFTKDNKKKYAFLNFNDDLSQCTPGIKQLLSSTKTQMNKIKIQSPSIK